MYSIFVYDIFDEYDVGDFKTDSEEKSQFNENLLEDSGLLNAIDYEREVKEK